jgi:hypothetical protein
MEKKAEGQKVKTQSKNRKEKSKQSNRTQREKNDSLRLRLFKNYLVDDAGCWIWQGSTSHRGYGYLRNCYEHISAHKAAFLLHGGVLTSEKPFVLHSCHNRKCINPQHLRAGNAKENSSDMVAAGRQARGEKSGSAKLSSATVLAIRNAYALGKSKKEIVVEFGTNRKTITAIVERRTWKHI